MAALNEEGRLFQVSEDLTVHHLDRAEALENHRIIGKVRASIEREVNRACNSHAALVAELQECYDLFERCVKEQHHFRNMMLGLVSVRQTNIRAALNAAKEGSK